MPSATLAPARCATKAGVKSPARLADSLTPGRLFNNTQIRLSELLAALSTALDLTEGQPAGHAARSCLIATKLAEKVGLPSEDRSVVFYATLAEGPGVQLQRRENGVAVRGGRPGSQARY